jgi:hypothetical protein
MLCLTARASHTACIARPGLCSDVADESSRPPLLVTAGVEAIELSSSKLDLQADMTVRQLLQHDI